MTAGRTIHWAALYDAVTGGLLRLSEQSTIELAQLQPGEKVLDVGFVLFGHGHFDLGAYDAYMQGNLRDFEYPDAEIREALAALPKVE